MKVLLLTKFSETDEYVLQFAEKISRKEHVEIELLHVVNGYSEIPLQPNGQIIDHCTEYDVTPLLKRKAAMEQLCKDWRSRNKLISKSEVVIGRLETVLQHKLRSENFDAIFMGAHPTNLLEDWFKDTTIERVMQSVNVPVMSLKCDRSHERHIERIGVFNDFESEKPERIALISAIANAFDAEVHLYKILPEGVSTELSDLEVKMKAFASENKLANVQFHVLSEKGSDEKTMNRHLITEKLNLVVVPQLHRKSVSWIYPSDLKSSIANHLYAPLIIY